MSKKIFLTSWPTGELKIVEVLDKRVDISDSFYIRYEGGGTDTTTSSFLFDIPKSLMEEEDMREVVLRKELELRDDYIKTVEGMLRRAMTAITKQAGILLPESAKHPWWQEAKDMLKEN